MVKLTNVLTETTFPSLIDVCNDQYPFGGNNELFQLVKTLTINQPCRISKVETQMKATKQKL
jgi:hypothetical protein